MAIRERILSGITAALAVQAPVVPVASEVRVDASGGAAVANDVSGLGTAGDSGASARPVARLDLNEDELIYAFKGTLYRRICELMPRWATKKGAKLTDNTDDDAPLSEQMKRLGVMGAFRRADTWGAALGESRILIVTDDPTPWREPLDPKNITRIKRLEVFDRREFTVASYNHDVDAADLGWPETYNLHPRRPVTFPSDVIHTSRLLRFYGNDLPPSELGYSHSSHYGWGADAIGQVLWDGIRNLSQLGAAGAHLAQQLSIAVFHIDAIKGKTAAESREATHAKYRALARMMSVMRAVFLGRDEKMERVAANPSGFGDLSEDARLQLALVTGRPMTLLFGEAPGGLNTDGDSWKEIWYGDVAAHQEERYREPLEYLIKLLYLTEGGGIPDTWALEFNPLQELTRLEKAQARLIESQADGNAITDGVITPANVFPRYTVPGGYGGLQPLEEPEDKAAETAPPRIGEITSAIDLGKAINEGSLNREQVLAIAIGSLKLPPDQAEALASGIPQTEAAPDRADEVDKRNRARGPGTKRGAREALNKAISRGDLERPAKCPKCSKGGQIEAHHADYSKPTEVTWLCSQCHSDLHKKADASDPTSACVLIPLSEAAKARWLSVVAMAEVIVGPLEREEYPHVTAHHVGPLPDGPALDLEHIVELAAKEFGPIDARPERVGALGSEDRPAIVLHLGGWGIDALPNALSRRAGYLSTTPPYDEYRPHVTLGYLNRELTTEELAGLADIPLPKEWTLALAVLQLSRGDHVKSYPLSGSRRDADD